MAIKQDNERKKAYLRMYRVHVRRIKRIESDLEEIRELKRFPASVMDGMPRSSSGPGDLSGYAAEIDLKERELLKEKNCRISEYNEITRRINLLENEIERDVLHYRYIKGFEWWKIAAEMGYCERHIHRFHGQALFNFQAPIEKMS